MEELGDTSTQQAENALGKLGDEKQQEDGQKHPGCAIRLALFIIEPGVFLLLFVFVQANIHFIVISRYAAIDIMGTFIQGSHPVRIVPTHQDLPPPLSLQQSPNQP